MNKTKKTVDTEDKPDAKIRIILRDTCPKLSKRGLGELTYELGVDNKEERFIRIADNPQGGSFSPEWINLHAVEDLLENRGEDNQTFKASFFAKAFIGRSSNNPGCLAAILKSEEVIILGTPEHPTQLSYLSFDGIKAKIDSLKLEDIDLTDHVAANLKEREKNKQQRLAERTAAKSKAKVKQTQTTAKKKKVAKQPDTKSGQ